MAIGDKGLSSSPSKGTVTQKISNVEYTWTATGATNSPESGNFSVAKSQDGLQLGSSKKPLGEYTLTLGTELSNIKKIVVKAYTNSDGNTLVAGVGKTTFGDAVRLTTSANKGEYTFQTDNPISGNVVISGNDKAKYVKIQSITIIYNEGTSSILTPAGLSYETDAYTVELGEAFTAPTLTNPNGLTVSYSSSKPEVATVDKTTGEVSIVGEGETTITAAFAGDDTYEEGSASYTLTVTTPFVIEDGVFNFEAKKSDYSSGVETTTNGNTYVTESKTWTAGNVTLVTSGKYRWWNNDGTLRFYSNNPTSAMTISVPNGYVITNIAITGGTSFSANIGNYSSGKWTGESQEVILTYAASSGSVNVKSVTVTYEEEQTAAVEAPTFSLPDGTYYEEQNVTISCETEGAKIYYTTDGTEPTTASTEYTGTITISTTTTLKAIAVKGEDASAVATATYTFPRVYALGEMNIQAEGTYNVRFNNAIVTYVNGNYVFIEDNTGAILYFKSKHGMKEKQVLDGIASVTWKLYNGQPEATAIADISGVGFSTEETVESVLPTVVMLAELSGDNKDNYISEFVTVEGVTVEEGKLVQGESVLAYYVRNNVSLTEGSKYDLTGFLGIYEKNGVKTYQLCLYTTDHVKEYPKTPTFTPDAGTYEEVQSVTMACETEGAEIYYTTDGTEPTTESTKYVEAIAIGEGTTTLKAIAVKDGVRSEVAEATYVVEIPQPVVEPDPVEVAEGYYLIKNNGNGKYVKVAGRKTVAFVDETAAEKAAGTVMKVKSSENGQVEVLRSQGVDLPGYADRAMRYVPKVVQLVAEKLHAEGSGSLLGENGLDALMKKFDESFDYHLYLEKAGEEAEAVRIYGRTPSMEPVVEFYQENKAQVDAKLPQLEGFINDAIEKVLKKTGGRGASILTAFSLQTVWEKMGKTLTEPADDATKLAFLQEVLASKETVWQFAYQTAMIYWTNLKNHPKFAEYKDKLGEYAQYIDKMEYVRPDVKYYLVQKNGKMDVISQDNALLAEGGASWTLEKRETFTVDFPEDNLLHGKYYTTLYTDFAYTLPEGVKALKVTEVSEGGVALTEELTGVVPAQTPVLLEAEAAGGQTLTLSTETGTKVTGNLLVGADYLIREYELKTAQVESLFDMAKSLLGENGYNNYVKEYEYLMLKNAGTVGNKYFFGLDADDLKGVSGLRMLGLDNAGENLGFHDIWTIVAANQAFLMNEQFNPVKLWLKGDVNRDGRVTIADVTALVNIILGKATYPEDADKYDFEAADVNEDEQISIADVTALVNIILGK